MREALLERETLWRIAPHIIWPLRFVLPHHKGLRPAWLLRLGLFLYDHIGGRRLLPPTRTLHLAPRLGRRSRSSREYSRGFEYSDCWVEDSRLVVLNARDAADRGATIAPRTRCLAAKRERRLLAADAAGRNRRARTNEIRARTLVNAAGPWVGEVLDRVVARQRAGVGAPRQGQPYRRAAGSMRTIAAIFFQNADGRILFAIPYERDFTLIGTTDLDYSGDPAAVAASDERSLISARRRANISRRRSAESGSSGPIRACGRCMTTARPPRRPRRATMCSKSTRRRPAGAAECFRRQDHHLSAARRIGAGDARAASAGAGAAPGWTARERLPGGDFPVQGLRRKSPDAIALSLSGGPLADRLTRAYGTPAPKSRRRKVAPISAGLRRRPDRSGSALSRPSGMGDDRRGCGLATHQAGLATFPGRDRRLDDYLRVLLAAPQAAE